VTKAGQPAGEKPRAVKRAIHIAITHGPRQRDFLRLGVLRELLSCVEGQVVIWTPATREETFMSECTIDPRVSVRYLEPFTAGRLHNTWLRLRRRVFRSPTLLRNVWRIERHLLPCAAYEAVFRNELPAVLVATDPLTPAEWPITVAAAATGVPTLGLVRSWDHLHKRLSAYTSTVAVWNEINKREAVRLEHVPARSVHVVGAVQFDPYYSADAIIPRDEFLRSMKLDPARKTILLATGGPFFRLAQNSWLDELLAAAREGRFDFPVQLVCRTHPSDMLGPFIKYLRVPDVVMDMHEEYSPTLDWVIGLPALKRQANLMAHADVVITPGSTITLEAAIFDTPTVVVAYNNADPDTIRNVLEKFTFVHHFKEILDRNLVSVARNANEMIAQVNQLLADPAAYREQRRQIVRDWVGFTDGASAKRLARVIAEVAAQ
jgi:UDP-N-acetylglucosamine 2-epimerase